MHFTRTEHAPPVLTVPDTTSALRADFRVLRHYNNAAGSMAEVRDEKDAVEAAAQREPEAHKRHLYHRRLK